ncbi:class II aldolase/adducin family protein [Ferrithrix thermotolerans]|uniref:class II aldolase/adducin family protein n=1 Tax=Ferrithrix thermotolerans TaxID=209649 RepID=UPI001FEB6D94|nr:class II aldolase/adducin family protein [Ferrithrix thermotolerans]
MELSVELEIKVESTTTSYAEERQERKLHLAAAFRLFGRFGYDEGVAGHITARDPEDPDVFWVNPFGMDFSLITQRELIAVNSEGEVVEGRGSLNSAAFAIHSQVHKARPDVVAAAHAHSMAGKAFSSLGKLLSPITQDACAFYEDHALFDDYTGVVLSTEEGQRISRSLGDKKAVILRNHGLLTVGQSVGEAVWWFIAMDRSCQAQLMAEAAGVPVEISHEMAILTRSQVGSHIAGWFSFQPLLARALHESPELLG